MERQSETSPLLHPTSNDSSSSISTVGALEAGGNIVASRSNTTLYNEFIDQDNISARDMLRQEAGILLHRSIPVTMSYFLQFSFNFVNILSLGHLGANELAAAALANMTLFMFVNAPSVGLASALDTFCSTSFTASKDKTLMGFHLQRGLISIVIHFFLVLPMLLYITPVLMALKQDAEVAQLCGKFVTMQLWGSLPWMAFECIKRFLQAQGHMKSSTYVLLAVLPLHLANNYLLVWSPYVGIGFLGAALANVITFWAMLIGILMYCVRSDAREAWGGWTWRAVTTMVPYYRLAIPSMILVCSDWAAWELMAIAASYLGTTTLAAQSIVINTCSMTYQLTAGLSIAISNRVGNLLGQERAKRSRVSANVGIVLGACTGTMTSLFCVVVAGSWGRLYSSDPEVIEKVALIMPLCALFQLADAMNCVSGGVLRSLGRQSAGAWINFPAFYVIGFPLCLFLTYGSPALGVSGLWLGFSISVILAAVGQLYICVSADYKEEVRRCLAQVNKNQQFAAAGNQDDIVAA
ncbi:ethionine resistance protein [Kickxella alabastrina]|uniref:Ethionine resistance protein n=1 Tax=Kickxella alabastrina TaxID=61397 RepID=A0ACC1I9L7_9FUNG|nr:ethionine resistance protein [Kickxella alabastrina]